MKRFFISFSSEEASIAKYLRDYLNHLFNTHAEFFLSADGLASGDVWLDRLQAEIRDAESLLVILSPRSLTRPWINIETGAFWIHGRRMFPLLHGNLQPSQLHRPLIDYQATDLLKSSNVSSFIHTLSNLLDIPAPPRYDANDIGYHIRELDDMIFKTPQSNSEISDLLGMRVSSRPQDLMQFNIKPETPDLYYRVFYRTILDISGYTQDAAIITMEKDSNLRRRKFLVIRIENTKDSISEDQNKFLKIAINNETCECHLEALRNSYDTQYIRADDGYYPYDIGRLSDRERFFITLVFWRIRLHRVKLTFYLA